MTRLTWEGPLTSSEALLLTLSGPTTRTIELDRSGCSDAPLKVELSDEN